MATQKELFADRLLQVAQRTANFVMDEIESVTSQYFNRGYNSGGADEIVIADLANYNGLTPTEIGSVITAFQQLTNFFNNAAVTAADYEVTFDAVRDAKRVT